MDFSRQVVIVGGGITGLAAAHRVRELDPAAQVTLIEGSPRLGGVLHTETVNGFLVERGPDNFITNVPMAVDLCRALGLENELLPTSERHRRAFVVRRGRLIPVPDGFTLMTPRRLMPILTTPLLSPWGKLRLLFEFFIPPRKSEEDESLADFARRRLGREVFERLVEPLVAGIYTADAEELSVQAALPQFVEMEREHDGLLRAAWTAAKKAKEAEAKAAKLREAVATSGESPPESALASPREAARSEEPRSEGGARYGLFVALRHGMIQLVEALAHGLPPGAVRLNTRVERVAKHPAGGWGLWLASQSQPLMVKRLILATPAYQTAKLLADFDAPLANELSEIPYAGSAVVNLGYRREQVAHPLDGFGFVVPSIERRPILAGSFSSVKYAGRAPEGHVLLRVFLGGAKHPSLVERSEADLRLIATNELAKLLGVSGEPIFCDVARWPRSMPQYHVGHLSRVSQIDRYLRPHFGLQLAGSYLRGVGIPQCIYSATRAAERVMTTV
jgi:oxygen-dependent protoporphyrinogen oxidase